MYPSGIHQSLDSQLLTSGMTVKGKNITTFFAVNYKKILKSLRFLLSYHILKKINTSILITSVID